ncbi:hypothetical protein J2Z69_000204 [Paenibacillus shirakamiensis]|uniref:DUF3907 family protein n=1 Tax=Paenibacillus shirakamiensis TaxID=1265935 RepID=A0ABS4JBY7_9BACL|nr:DUF3907 family protein [Paenibacillus shirakamiensis]MBP1999185.1 hypothetical protein [Paenibacillus shirakamiensis]
MPETHVQQLCEDVKEKLKMAIPTIEKFLNENALSQLAPEQDEESIHFSKGFLTDLRHLLVYSEVVVEKLGTVLRRSNFDKELAEKILYSVYHDVVNSFFYPKNESYSEDGRYAYTGQDAIRFRIKPVRIARDVILEVTKIYEELRDELTYYESDYLTQRRMQKANA